MDTAIQPGFVQRLQEKLAASRFFTFSLLLHVVIVILAGSVVIMKHIAAPPDFAAEGGSGLVQDEASTAPPPQQEETTPQQFTPQQPQVQATVPTTDAIISNAVSPVSFTMAAPMPSLKAPAADMKDVTQKVNQAAAGIGMSGLPSTMAGRAGGKARGDAMKKMGGKDKSEKAVLAGLKWLKEHQEEDGSWGPKNKTAMTGLAVLCYLGHGETPESVDFGPTVKKGIDYLLKRGIANQGALAGAANRFGAQEVYEHAIGCYALGEYYTMTKDDRVKDVLVQGVGYIVQGQAPDGGWYYGYAKSDAKGEGSDTSVTGWQIQALKAAHLTGLGITGVDEALDKAMLDLKRVQNDKGAFGYHEPTQAGYSLTGVGVLCTYFWKGDKDRVVKDGIKYILEETEKNYPVEYKGPKANLYTWYYNTQACLMFGGNAWSKWNRWFQDQIADSQAPDGSWPPTGKAMSVGNFESDPTGAGPYYRTTLCVLMLEVFYRYMPTTK